jgi:hypothetical protein
MVFAEFLLRETEAMPGASQVFCEFVNLFE